MYCNGLLRNKERKKNIIKNSKIIFLREKQMTKKLPVIKKLL
jgi:hypothetical protein